MPKPYNSVYSQMGFPVTEGICRLYLVIFADHFVVLQSPQRSLRFQVD